MYDHKAYMKQYYKENKESFKEYNILHKEHRQEYQKKYESDNKEMLKEKRAKKRIENREEILLKEKAYRAANPGKQKEYDKTYDEKYPEKRKEINKKSKQKRKHLDAARKRERYHTDNNFKMKHLLRSRLKDVVRNKRKSGSSVSDLGCTIEELLKYIESLWLPGMNWDNWSQTGWHLDHIIPLSHFDLTGREQFLIACHYTNLQPLWAFDNMSKGNQILERNNDGDNSIN